MKQFAVNLVVIAVGFVAGWWWVKCWLWNPGVAGTVLVGYTVAVTTVAVTDHV